MKEELPKAFLNVAKILNKTFFTEVNQRKRFVSWKQNKHCILRGLLLQHQPGNQDNTFTWKNIA